MRGSYLSEVTRVDWAQRVTILVSNSAKPIIELWRGFSTKTVPLHWLLCFSFLFQCVLMLGWDRRLYVFLGVTWLYPVRSTSYSIYYVIALSLPFVLWGVVQANRRERLSRVLKDVFESIGLKNNLGRLPSFIVDRAIDPLTRKLTVSRAALSLSDFSKAKEGIESGLHVYVDEIRENRTGGTVDITYSSLAMPELCRIADYRNIPPPGFIIGSTRAKEIRANLNSVPHLLIAGQTGAGKSTFLRQFITTLYLNDKKCTFTLVDLKECLDSQLFENLPRIALPSSMDTAIYILSRLIRTIDYRMKVLRTNNCRDIGQFFKLAKGKRQLPSPDSSEIIPGLNRHVIIVDEAAEMFLAGDKTKAKEAQEARRILSKVARQGRSLGLHLIVATQRPDSRALDPQIKANLTGVLCFQMVNDISSILVLGNGRATDLPPVPGRAIWKAGLEMCEVQTPYLDDDEVKELLKDERTLPSALSQSTVPSKTPVTKVDALKPMVENAKQ